MHPILISNLKLPFIGNTINIYCYGVFLFLSISVGICLVVLQSKKQNLDGITVFIFCVTLIYFGLAGARMLFLLRHIREVMVDPWFYIKGGGGLDFLGGLIAGTFASFMLTSLFSLPRWKLADICAPSLALGESLARIGCLLGGCCYGRPTQLPFGIIFQDPLSPATPKGIPLHPTQLYLAFASVGLYLILIKYANKKNFDGQLFIWYLYGSGIIKFIIEFYRNDDRIPQFFGLFSTNQFIAIGLILAGLCLTYYLRKKINSSVIPM